MKLQSRSVYDVLQFWLASWRFPLFFICFLFFYTLLQGIVLALPTSGDTLLASFADEFKTWCFGYDPATKTFETAYLVMMIVNPVVIAGLVAGIWWKSLCEVYRENKPAVYRTVSLTFTLALIMMASLAVLFKKPPSSFAAEMPFPAESLRTSYAARPISLVNQLGDPVQLAELKGKVILVTAVYATCGYTCPMIMAQTKRAVASLTESEQNDLRVLAITLDPTRDSTQVLAGMAAGQQIEAPTFQLLTGPPVEVERILDEYEFARSINPETGVIDHANLFILIDRSGRIAYRFTLGDRQEQWLITALRLLLNEDVS